MKRTQAGLISLGILFIGVIGIATNQRAQSGDRSEQPTIVKRGARTERQREHSKLFTGRSFSTKERLTDSRETELRLTVGSEEGSFPFEDRLDLNQLVRNRTCDSDAVLIGKVAAKESQLTLEDDFIFTDYTVVVESILKDDNYRSLQRNGRIVVTRAGGKVSLNGRTITVVDRDSERLIIGDKYLLFLKRVPKTGAYISLSGSSYISEDNGELDKLTEHLRGEFLPGTQIGSVSDLIALYKNAPCEVKP